MKSKVVNFPQKNDLENNYFPDKKQEVLNERSTGLRKRRRKKIREGAATPYPRTAHKKIHTGVQHITSWCGGYRGYGVEKSATGIGGTNEAARRSLDMLVRKKNGEPIKTKLVISDLPDGNYHCAFMSWVDREEVGDE